MRNCFKRYTTMQLLVIISTFALASADIGEKLRLLSQQNQANVNPYDQTSGQNLLAVSGANIVGQNAKSTKKEREHTLEELCNDAFHSFLCKPVTGRRRRIDGNIRPGAQLPPGFLRPESSNQREAKVLPNQSGQSLLSDSLAPDNSFGYPQSSNQIDQGYVYPKPSDINQVVRPSNAYLPVEPVQPLPLPVRRPPPPPPPPQPVIFSTTTSRPFSTTQRPTPPPLPPLPVLPAQQTFINSYVPPASSTFRPSTPAPTTTPATLRPIKFEAFPSQQQNLFNTYLPPFPSTTTRRPPIKYQQAPQQQQYVFNTFPPVTVTTSRPVTTTTSRPFNPPSSIIYQPLATNQNLFGSFQRVTPVVTSTFPTTPRIPLTTRLVTTTLTPIRFQALNQPSSDYLPPYSPAPASLITTTLRPIQDISSSFAPFQYASTPAPTVITTTLRPTPAPISYSPITTTFETQTSRPTQLIPLASFQSFNTKPDNSYLPPENIDVRFSDALANKPTILQPQPVLAPSFFPRQDNLEKLCSDPLYSLYCSTIQNPKVIFTERIRPQPQIQYVPLPVSTSFTSPSRLPQSFPISAPLLPLQNEQSLNFAFPLNNDASAPSYTTTVRPASSTFLSTTSAQALGYSSTTLQPVSNGYSYSNPTSNPFFSVSTTPRPISTSTVSYPSSSLPSVEYSPAASNGYNYPAPSDNQFFSVSTTTARPSTVSIPPSPSAGYEYPRSSNNQPVTLSTTPRPSSPFTGYEYPKPSPTQIFPFAQNGGDKSYEFPQPSQSQQFTVKPQNEVTGYDYPKPSGSQVFQLPTSPKPSYPKEDDGYFYPKPENRFNDGGFVNNFFQKNQFQTSQPFGQSSAPSFNSFSSPPSFSSNIDQLIGPANPLNNNNGLPPSSQFEIIKL